MATRIKSYRLSRRIPICEAILSYQLLERRLVLAMENGIIAPIDWELLESVLFLDGNGNTGIRSDWDTDDDGVADLRREELEVVRAESDRADIEVREDFGLDGVLDLHTVETSFDIRFGEVDGIRVAVDIDNIAGLDEWEYLAYYQDEKGDSIEYTERSLYADPNVIVTSSFIRYIYDQEELVSMEHRLDKDGDGEIDMTWIEEIVPGEDLPGEIGGDDLADEDPTIYDRTDKLDDRDRVYESVETWDWEGDGIVDLREVSRFDHFDSGELKASRIWIDQNADGLFNEYQTIRFTIEGWIESTLREIDASQDGQIEQRFLETNHFGSDLELVAISFETDLDGNGIFEAANWEYFDQSDDLPYDITKGGPGGSDLHDPESESESESESEKPADLSGAALSFSAKIMERVNEAIFPRNAASRGAGDSPDNKIDDSNGRSQGKVEGRNTRAARRIQFKRLSWVEDTLNGDFEQSIEVAPKKVGR